MCGTYEEFGKEFLEDLFDRYEFEMKKLIVMERMVIQIRKRMERGNNDDFRHILASYDVELLHQPFNK